MISLHTLVSIAGGLRSPENRGKIKPSGSFFQGTQMIALLRSLGLIFIAATSATNAGPTPAWIARINQLAEPVFLDRG